MNKPNTEIKRWGIIVVQSLTPNDVKTGEILYHDVLQYKEYHWSITNRVGKQVQACLL